MPIPARPRSLGGIRQQFSTPRKHRPVAVRPETYPQTQERIRRRGRCELPRARLSEPRHRPRACRCSKPTRAPRSRGCATTSSSNAADLVAGFRGSALEGLGGGCFGRSGEGWLDPYSLMTLLRKAAVSAGVELITDEVASIANDGDEVIGLDARRRNRLAVRRAGQCGRRRRRRDCRHGRHRAAGRSPQALRLCARLPGRQRGAARFAAHRRSIGLLFSPGGSTLLSGFRPMPPKNQRKWTGTSITAWFEDRIWPLLAAAHAGVRDAQGDQRLGRPVRLQRARRERRSSAAIPRSPISISPTVSPGHGLQQAPAAGNAIAELIVHGRSSTIDLGRMGYERVGAREPYGELNII